MCGPWAGPKGRMFAGKSGTDCRFILVNLLATGLVHHSVKLYIYLFAKPPLDKTRFRLSYI
jgi:hypothetical protein